ncbi:hypothetical protein ACFYY8_37870 [Streptosporangium sp. NPDC001559]|uniref:hypothetical protein n=1 Tax=Streptosporangium sp. NPDC001559 TaxID=3366187 RepID=UPI0036E1BF2E
MASRVATTRDSRRELFDLVVLRLIEPRVRARERDRVLTALGLPADPREHLAELADVLDGAFREVGAGLATDDAARIKDGKLSPARSRDPNAAPDDAAEERRTTFHATQTTITIGIYGPDAADRITPCAPPWPCSSPSTG